MDLDDIFNDDLSAQMASLLDTETESNLSANMVYGDLIKMRRKSRATGGNNNNNSSGNNLLGSSRDSSADGGRYVVFVFVFML